MDALWILLKLLTFSLSVCSSLSHTHTHSRRINKSLSQSSKLIWFDRRFFVVFCEIFASQRKYTSWLYQIDDVQLKWVNNCTVHKYSATPNGNQTNNNEDYDGGGGGQRFEKIEILITSADCWQWPRRFKKWKQTIIESGIWDWA